MVNECEHLETRTFERRIRNGAIVYEKKCRWCGGHVQFVRKSEAVKIGFIRMEYDQRDLFARQEWQDD